MPFKKDGEFKFSSKDEIVIEEKGNMYTKLAMVAWGKTAEEATDEDYRLDIRKYMTNSDGSEQMKKGVSFMTPEGPTALTNELVSRGFGDTDHILQDLKDRKDYEAAVKKVYGGEVGEEEVDDSFDLRDFL